MSVADLKARLADVPGIETLTMQLSGERNVLSWGQGLTRRMTTVTPFASDNDIEAAVRLLANVGETSPVPTQPKEEPMSVTGAGYVAGSLADRLRAVRSKIEQGSARMDAALSKMDQAASAHSALADTVAGEADALLAEVGQFTNGGT